VWEAGQRPSPPPVSYAYGWAPGPPPAKSGPGTILAHDSEPEAQMWKLKANKQDGKIYQTNFFAQNVANEKAECSKFVIMHILKNYVSFTWQIQCVVGIVKFSHHHVTSVRWYYRCLLFYYRQFLLFSCYFSYADPVDHSSKYCTCCFGFYKRHFLSKYSTAECCSGRRLWMHEHKSWRKMLYRPKRSDCTSDSQTRLILTLWCEARSSRLIYPAELRQFSSRLLPHE